MRARCTLNIIKEVCRSPSAPSVAAVLKAGKVRTPDLGGNGTTVAMADAVVAAVK